MQVPFFSRPAFVVPPISRSGVRTHLGHSRSGYFDAAKMNGFILFQQYRSREGGTETTESSRRRSRRGFQPRFFYQAAASRFYFRARTISTCAILGLRI